MEKCNYKFEKLASSRFPKLIKAFKESFKSSYSVKELFKEGNGHKSILRILGKQEDFKGIYCFLDNQKPIYFGISQNVVRRLVQHTKNNDHNSASLAYQICKKLNGRGIKGRKKLKMEKGIHYLGKFNVALLELECPIERYLFEIYCCMEYQTEWNSFETH